MFNQYEHPAITETLRYGELHSPAPPDDEVIGFVEVEDKEFAVIAGRMLEKEKAQRLAAKKGQVA